MGAGFVSLSLRPRTALASVCLRVRSTTRPEHGHSVRCVNAWTPNSFAASTTGRDAYVRYACLRRALVVISVAARAVHSLLQRLQPNSNRITPQTDGLESEARCPGLELSAA